MWALTGGHALLSFSFEKSVETCAKIAVRQKEEKKQNHYCWLRRNGISLDLNWVWDSIKTRLILERVKKFPLPCAQGPLEWDKLFRLFSYSWIGLFFLCYEEIYGLRSYFVVDDLIASFNCNDILDFLALESADDFHYQKHCIFGDGCCQDTFPNWYFSHFSFQIKPFLPMYLQAARNIRPLTQRKVCNQHHIIKVSHLNYANKSDKLKPFVKKNICLNQIHFLVGRLVLAK